MLERLMMIEKRYLELNEELMKPEIISDVKETLKRTKEQALLKDAYEEISRFYNNPDFPRKIYYNFKKILLS